MTPYLPTARGPSARDVLGVVWDHPVVRYQAAEAADGHTVARQVKRALPLAEALRRIAGEDRRPLLVLRECNHCSGTEDALFTREADNERTYLLSRWFHCVKLPPAVLEEDHPFHALFPGESPSHLFLSTFDGQHRHDLTGAQSRRELWNAMEATLARTYRDSPKKPLRSLAKILDELDGVDLELWELQTKLELELADGQPDARKLKKLQAKVERLEKEREELRTEVEQVASLRLLPAEDVETPPKKDG